MGAEQSKPGSMVQVALDLGGKILNGDLPASLKNIIRLPPGQQHFIMVPYSLTPLKPKTALPKPLPSKKQ